MKKHINADFFKLLIAFLLICASLKPGLADAMTINTDTPFIRAENTAFTLSAINSSAPVILPYFRL